jgi:hypothetical protein
MRLVVLFANMGLLRCCTQKKINHHEGLQYNYINQLCWSPIKFKGFAIIKNNDLLRLNQQKIESFKLEKLIINFSINEF